MLVKVEMKDLIVETESLVNFLTKHYKLHPSLNRKGLELTEEDVSTFGVVRMVNKFLGSKKLNSTHWASVQGNAVLINRFNRKKSEKKNKHPTAPHMISHGW
jgi:hypothetical protein